MIRTLEGIVIRQTKITGGRRMVQIFTKEEGKISAGTFISEKSKGGTALALRPFSHGQYQITEKSKDLVQITSAETIDSHFAIGEDPERFADAAFALELTDKLLPENIGEPVVFELLKEYLDIMIRRKNNFRLITVSYMVKVMQELGLFPDSDSIKGGELISGLNGDILDILVFIEEQPLGRMEKLTLDSEKEGAVFDLIKDFAHKHLDLGIIKSERLFAQGSKIN